MEFFLSFFTSVLVSVTLIPVLIRLAGTLNMMDDPGDRKVHTIPIPRCGGIGIASGVIIAFLLFIPFDNTVISLVAGGGIIIVFGLIDDRISLSYQWKFGGQFLAVFVTVAGGLTFTYLPFCGLEPASVFLTLPLTVVFVIGVTNAVNLSDGLDGLAAGVMLLSISAIAFLAVLGKGDDVVIMSLAIAGGIVGFLWFNTHPAIVFMGDTGSQFIGFMVAFLSIYLTQDVFQALNPALPLLLLGFPVLDTIFVMTLRIRSGSSPFSPDQRHIHHRLLKIGFTHPEAVGTIYLLQGVFLLAAFLLRYASDFMVVAFYFLICSSILAFLHFAKVYRWSLHPPQEKVDGRRGKWNIWRSDRLFRFTKYYIEYSITLFLVVFIGVLYWQLHTQFLQLLTVIGASLGLFLFVPKVLQDLFVRISIYFSAVFSFMLANANPEIQIISNWTLNIYFGLLIFVVFVAIRITRKTDFRLTTQDVLVALFISATIALVNIEYIGHVLFRLFCLAYALEYLLNRRYDAFKPLKFMAILAGVLIIVVVLPGLE
jgi:UDP-GlcNAc:undecaprenyl-phosphate GlcNAc-1-phosphate transferase